MLMYPEKRSCCAAVVSSIERQSSRHEGSPRSGGARLAMRRNWPWNVRRMATGPASPPPLAPPLLPQADRGGSVACPEQSCPSSAPTVTAAPSLLLPELLRSLRPPLTLEGAARFLGGSAALGFARIAAFGMFFPMTFVRRHRGALACGYVPPSGYNLPLGWGRGVHVHVHVHAHVHVVSSAHGCTMHI